MTLPARTSSAAEAAAETGRTRSRLVGSRTGALADGIVEVVRLASVVRGAAGRVLRRAVSVVTPLGWVVAGLAPVCLVAGYALGLREAVAVGWALVVLAVVAVLSLLGRSRFDVSLELPHPRVVAGEPAAGVVAVRNPRGLRSLGTRLEVPVGSTTVELAVPGLRPRAEHVEGFDIPTRRRGVVPIGPVRSVRADPLGLVRREVQWTGETVLTVHPRTIAAPATSTGLVHDLEGQTTRELTASDVAFHALREYQRGDERRYIHWKSSAKTGTYMVRQFEQTRRSHLVVALSLAPEDYATDEEFELGVSVTASLGVRAIRDGRSISVVTSTVVPEFAKRAVPNVRALATHRPDRLLDELALVELAPGAIGLHEVARVVADRTESVSVAFLVCGSRVGQARLRSAVHAFPEDVAVVAVVCDPEAEPGLRRIAGLGILSVGFLDDLRAALLRTAAG